MVSHSLEIGRLEMLANILNIIFILSASSVGWAEIETNGSQGLFKRVAGVRYYFGNETVDWYKAFAKCRLVGGFLASMDEPSEASKLWDYLSINYEGNVWWLSGADFHKKGNFYWYGTGHALYHSAGYRKKLVDNHYNKNCVRLMISKTKFDIENGACKKKSQYICEFEKPKTVVNGKLEGKNVPFDKVGEKFYYLSKKMRSWHKAFLRCRSMGSNLASISGAYEMKELSNHLAKKNTTVKQWWLSGAKFNRNTNFVWYGTGNKFNYKHWSEFLISELKNANRCVQVWDENPGYKMTVFPCNVRYNYICEMSKTN